MQDTRYRILRFKVSNYLNKNYMKKIFLLICICIVFFTNSIFAQIFPDSWTDGKYYTVNGAKLYTVTVGTGEPLFIIPGGPGGMHLGYRGLDSLTVNSNIQLIYFDGFGRGKSDTADRKSVV